MPPLPVFHSLLSKPVTQAYWVTGPATHSALPVQGSRRQDYSNHGWLPYSRKVSLSVVGTLASLLMHLIALHIN